MIDKPKYPRSAAIAAAKEILAELITERVVIAGSLRRRKPLVGDIEILYIPKTETGPDPADLFSHRTLNLTDQSIQAMIQRRLIAPRENTLGSTTWGEKNKLARHLPSGIPVDFFATSPRAWHNYLVCRTGGAENNVAISTAAQKKGWSWHPYRSGFTDDQGQFVPVHSEQDVFTLIGLPYLEPWQRP